MGDTAPAQPAAELPVVSDKEPDAPPVAEPVLSETAPLEPASASAEDMATAAPLIRVRIFSREVAEGGPKRQKSSPRPSTPRANRSPRTVPALHVPPARLHTPQFEFH